MEIGYDVGERQTQDWMNELHGVREEDPDRARDVAYDNDVPELEEHPDDYATFGDPDAAYDAYRDARDEADGWVR